MPGEFAALVIDLVPLLTKPGRGHRPGLLCRSATSGGQRKPTAGVGQGACQNPPCVFGWDSLIPRRAQELTPPQTSSVRRAAGEAQKGARFAEAIAAVRG